MEVKNQTDAVEKIDITSKNLTTLGFMYFKPAANLIDDEIGVFKEKSYRRVLYYFG